MTDWLNEIKARAGAATPGTWCTEYDGTGTYTITADVRLHLDEGFSFGPPICTLAPDGDGTQAYANAEFIARARADVPRLLDWIGQLQAEVASLRREKEQLRMALIRGAA
ncbi:hypothetical protein ACFVFF_23045 [Streptomyces sp. NPDC057680]|uniref:hypothetical protein n=1 Tax=Streptomyces sp. NPDC057680 TaxID=3346208 RepID=UPI0036AD0ACA